jgi:hypothetical protein
MATGSTSDDRGAQLDEGAGTWWQEPIAQFIEYIAEERDLVELTRVSVEVLGSQDATSRLVQIAAENLPRAVAAKDIVRRAAAEVEVDHSMLHAHSLVTIWGALETMVMDVVVTWLIHRPAILSTPKIAEMKVPYSAFESLTREERMDALANELDRQRGIRAGVQRFEGVLDAVGLSGSLDPQLTKNVYEMQQVRNVFAHKRGIADRRFVTACPHLGYTVDDRITIGRDTWTDFTVTVVAYADVIGRRARHKLGLDAGGTTPSVRAIRYRAALSP